MKGGKILVLNFALDSGKQMSIQLKDPIDDLNAETINDTAEAIINGKIFKKGEAEVTEILEAYILERTYTPLV